MHPTRIPMQKLDFWLRLFAWYFLFLSLFNLSVYIYYWVKGIIDPESVGLIAGLPLEAFDITYLCKTVFRQLYNIMVPVFLLLLALGASKLIRYLLALRDSIGKPQRKVSPGQS